MLKDELIHKVSRLGNLKKEVEDNTSVDDYHSFITSKLNKGIGLGEAKAQWDNRITALAVEKLQGVNKPMQDRDYGYTIEDDYLVEAPKEKHNLDLQKTINEADLRIETNQMYFDSKGTPMSEASLNDIRNAQRIKLTTEWLLKEQQHKR